MPDIDPRIVSRVKNHQLQIVADIYCPTWQYEPYRRWERFLQRWFRMPARWFKEPKKSRVTYWLPGNKLVCSYENYAAIIKAVEGEES